jgi:hypothetical protein
MTTQTQAVRLVLDEGKRRMRRPRPRSPTRAWVQREPITGPDRVTAERGVAQLRKETASCGSSGRSKNAAAFTKEPARIRSR